VKVRPTRPERLEKETDLVANPGFFAPAVFACFRVSHPENLEGLWLASSPSVLGFPRTLGSSALAVPRRLRILVVGRLLSCTSTPPQRLSSHAPPLYSCLMPTMSHFRRAPRYVHPALQHLRIRGTPFFAPFRRRPAGFTLPAGGPAPRVWLPFQRPQRSPALGGLFQPPTLLGFALQSLSPARRSTTGFPVFSPPSRFPTKPIGFVPAPRRLAPTAPAVPLVAIRVFSSDRGLTALLGLPTSRAFPSLDRRRASLPSLTLPPFDPRGLSTT
jgi:hypothetical protein